MKVLELFSGNADITKAFRAAGHTCVSVDYDEKKNADLCCDVYSLSDDFLKSFDFIWLSPDCTTYSIASHGLRRAVGGSPLDDYGKFCDRSNDLLLSRLKRFGIPFICENPRGHFRSMPFVVGLSRVTVFYSTYGLPYEKPTDLFSNFDLFGFFDLSKKKGSMSLDYCASSFLARCLMPKLLIDDIVRCAEIVVSGLAYRPYKTDLDIWEYYKDEH